MSGFLVILRDFALRPTFAWHATGALSEIDRRREIARLPVPALHAGRPLAQLTAVMAFEIRQAMLDAGIRSDGTVPPRAE